MMKLNVISVGAICGEALFEIVPPKARRTVFLPNSSVNSNQNYST